MCKVWFSVSWAKKSSLTQHISETLSSDFFICTIVHIIIINNTNYGNVYIYIYQYINSPPPLPSHITHNTLSLSLTLKLAVISCNYLFYVYCDVYHRRRLFMTNNSSLPPLLYDYYPFYYNIYSTMTPLPWRHTPSTMTSLKRYLHTKCFIPFPHILLGLTPHLLKRLVRAK